MPAAKLKKIVGVKLVKTVDECPDLSYLGEYTDKYSDWVIDCEQGEFVHNLEEAGRRVCFKEAIHYIDGCDDLSEYTSDAWSGVNCSECRKIGKQTPVSEPVPYELPNRKGLFRFFEPYAGGEKPGTEDYQKYGMQDFARMEDLNRGEWCMLNVCVRADIEIAGTAQHVEAGHCGSVESDADMDEFINDGLHELHLVLTDMGFSKRAIDRAFKEIETED